MAFHLNRTDCVGEKYPIVSLLGKKSLNSSAEKQALIKFQFRNERDFKYALKNALMNLIV